MGADRPVRCRGRIRQGAAPLTGGGQVGYFSSSGNTIVRASTDADAASELEIQLTGIKNLSIDDFYL